MTIELTHAESTALRELLERHLGDMSAEIAHTDSPTFRSGFAKNASSCDRSARS